jgi:UrcA family protein
MFYSGSTGTTASFPSLSPLEDTWSQIMTSNRIALLGSALFGAALICGGGVAIAQDYSPGYYDRDYAPPQPGYTPEQGFHYGPTHEDVSEAIIVRPGYGYAEKRNLIGRHDGEINPTQYSISRPVSYSDLDLTRHADFVELRIRVREAASDMCLQLDDQFPELRNDRNADMECIRDATRQAMRSVPSPYS